MRTGPFRARFFNWIPLNICCRTVGRLNAEIVKIGAVPVGNSAAQMASQIKTDTERYAKLAKEARITAQYACAQGLNGVNLSGSAGNQPLV